MQFIGLDLGTSSVKALLINESGTVEASCSKGYPCFHRNPGWSEQEPLDWYMSSMAAIRDLLNDSDANPLDVHGIGIGGQMHGLVTLDEDDAVVRPAILWNDGRSEQESKYLNNQIGVDRLSEWCGNISFPGFTAPKLLWMRTHEPDYFGRIRKVMLPKDYLVYRLSGEFSTDVSDASGTLLFDVRNRCWSADMLGLCGLSIEQMPKIHESFESVGALSTDTARELGLTNDVIVVAGAGDNAAAAVGCGAVKEGRCNISLGTSGTVFFPSNTFCVDDKNALHSFDDATGKYHLMGCILSAASAYSWWTEAILGCNVYTNLEGEISELGVNPVLFLPYLMGERSPVNDSEARGAFVGMSLDTTQAQMTQAVMEGVAFALRDCFEHAEALDIRIDRVTVCGGGARNNIWRSILANVLGRPIALLEREEGPGFGAGILAMVGCGLYPSVIDAALKFNPVKSLVPYDPAVAAKYNQRYEKYKELYPALRHVFHSEERCDHDRAL